MMYRTLLVFSIGLLVTWMTGKLDYQLVPDSASYIEYPIDSIDEALRHIRSPGYPIFVEFLERTLGLAAIPIVQLLIHSIAAVLLINELMIRNVTKPIAWIGGLAVQFGCTAIDNVAIIATDLLAASLGVFTVVYFLRWERMCMPWRAAVPLVVTALLAISVRPAYLSMIPWLFIAGCLFSARGRFQSLMQDEGFVLRTRGYLLGVLKSLVIAACVALPVVGWMGLRGAVVNDFGVLPFGHQNLAGVTMQLASDDELIELEGDAGDLATAILAARDAYLLSGGTWDEGQSTMAIESRWNDYVWQIIVPVSMDRAGNDVVKAHRDLKVLNNAIVSHFPHRYLRWIILAVRRAVWGAAANIAMHPLFLACLIVTVGAEVVRLVLGRGSCGDTMPDGLNALFLIAVSYFFCNIGFVVLTSPPIGRFTDAAAIFIPSYLCMLAALHISNSFGNSSSLFPVLVEEPAA